MQTVTQAEGERRAGEPEGGTQVFISYSRQDASFAEQLCDSLIRSGISVWIDREGIRHGENFWDTIADAIDEAAAFVFIITPHSVAQTSYCRKELAYAVEHNKRLLPVLRAEVPKDSPDQVDPRLAQIDYTFMRDGDDFDREVTLLVEAINILPAWHRQHARLLIQAQKWVADKSDTSLLLRDRQLREAEQWQSQADGAYQAPAPVERDFILASQSDERLRHRRRTRVTSGVIASLSLLLVAALVAAVIAKQEQAQAEQQRNIAVGRELGAQAEVDRVTYPNLLPRTALLAIESLRRVPSSQADGTLRRATALLGHELACIKQNRHLLTLAISPDGRKLALASYSTSFDPRKSMAQQQATGEVSLWDARSGREIGQRLYPNAFIRALGFDTAGKTLEIGLPTGVQAVTTDSAMRVTRSLPLLGSPVALSPDGRYAITLQEDAVPPVLRVWDVVTHRQVLPPVAGTVYSAPVFSPDGRALALASATQIRVWHRSGGGWVEAAPLALPPSGNRDVMEAMALGPRGSTIAITMELPGPNEGNATYSGTLSGVTCAESAATTDPVHATVSVYRAGAGWVSDGQFSQSDLVRALAFNSAGSELAVARYNGTAQVRGTTGGWPELMSLSHSADVRAVAFSRYGSDLATISADGTARVWADRRPWSEVAGTYTASMDTWSFAPRRTAITATVSNGARMLGRSPCGRLVRTAAISSAEQSWFSANGSYLLSVVPVGQGAVAQVELTDYAHCWGRTTPLTDVKLPELASGAVDAGGRYAALYVPRASGGVVRVWSIGASGRSVAWTSAETLPVPVQLAISPRGQYLAAVSPPAHGTEPAIHVWRAGSGQPVATWRDRNGGEDEPVFFSPNARYLATIWKSRLTLWDPTSGKTVLTLPQESGIQGSAFSPDSRFVAIAGADDTVRIVDLSSRTEVTRFDFGSPVTQVQFSPDGEYLGVSVGGGIELLRWRQTDAVRAACSELSRNLTRDEWQQFVGSEPYRKTCPNLPAG